MNTESIIAKINAAASIDDVCEILGAACDGVSVFFEPSRRWCLAYHVPGGLAGAYRPYMGGGVRGSICAATGDTDRNTIFAAGLARVEQLFNDGADDCEPWDLPSGVLLNN